MYIYNFKYARHLKNNPCFCSGRSATFYKITGEMYHAKYWDQCSEHSFYHPSSL